MPNKEAVALELTTERKTMKTQLRPQSEVLHDVKTLLPEVHVELERDWVWIAGDFYKDPVVREMMKALGFKYKKADHILPSGKVAHWAHCCMHPTPFKRKGKGGKEDSPAVAYDEKALDDAITSANW